MTFSKPHVLTISGLSLSALNVLQGKETDKRAEQQPVPLLTIGSLVYVVSLFFAVIPGSALSRSSTLELC